MNNQADIRWEQRFANFNKAMIQFRKFIDKGILSELEEQGLIKAFEYTYELAWNVLRDYFREQGVQNIFGSKDAIREAFSVGLISDGTIWMDMLHDRNLTDHSYNEKFAETIVKHIQHDYYPLFVSFQQRMASLLESK